METVKKRGGSKKGRKVVRRGYSGQEGWELLLIKLGVRKTPDACPKGGRGRAIKAGARTKLGAITFFYTLFNANEVVDANRKPGKMTDEEIKRQILLEYPNENYDDLKQFGPLGKVGRRTINELRIRYNAGRFSNGDLPQRFSFRYNIQGKAVDGRTGRRELTEAQQTKMRNDWINGGSETHRKADRQLRDQADRRMRRGK